MANALTGDFDAVLQIDQRVLRRLVAGLHRNDGSDPGIPTLPHAIALPVDRDGMRGELQAHIGVPVLSLIDRATDRFHMATRVRGLFTPTTEQAYLPPFINGTVHCDYRFAPLPPGTPGWGADAGDHIRVVVDPASIRFEGQASGSPDVIDTSVGDPGPRIQALLVDLLVNGLPATPHPLGGVFRPDRVITLVEGREAAVALPVVGDGDRQALDRIFLRGADLAVAISKEAIVGPLQRRLDRVRQEFGGTLSVRVTALFDIWEMVDIAWRLSIREASARWMGSDGHGNGAVEATLVLQARTENPVFDWAIHVTQQLSVDVEPSGRVRAHAPRDPVIRVEYVGPFADRVRQEVEQRALGYVRPQVAKLVGQVEIDLDLVAQAERLAGQLRRLDRGVAVSLGRSAADADGIVVLGRVTLSAPRRWKVTYGEEPEDAGFTALATWVPGGWIDAYHWHWIPDMGEPGSRADTASWLLRPREVAVGAGSGDLTGDPGGGMVLLGAFEQIPGLGRVGGSVELVVAGTYIDHETGELEPFTATSHPIDFALSVVVLHEGTTTGITHAGTLATGAELRRIILASLRNPLGPPPVGFAVDRPNSLVVRLGASTDVAEVGAGLRAAVASRSFEGVGLQVVGLVEAGHDPIDQVAADRGLRQALGDLVPSLVVEDVDGSWAGELGLPGDAGATWTALVSPHGGVPWADHGCVGGDDLATALDTFLVPSPPPRVVRIAQQVGEGDVLSPWALAGAGDGPPPPPIGRSGRRSVIAFVRPTADGTHDQLVDRLRADLAPAEDVLVTVVVHGVEEADVSRANLVDADPVIADPDGAIAARLGVSIWPTVLLVDGDGRVVRVLTTSWSATQVASAPTQEVAP
jgi:hypothetical protein